ncbi:MAG: methionyl-tRNA formyltransferase [Candidatus Marinimicrobia bacterium]|jgi:methionyl-tRNA formyltransferase|nr:methionyl-tRNA formyltransferase [Candidatus Neomarinimicrobiota bacterium]
MRIIFMGNPNFAVPSLQRISKSSHKIIAVVSNPPKRIGRGNKINETAVGIAAKAMGIPLLQPPKLNDKQLLQYLSWMKPDIFVVVAYKILSDRLLTIPNYGAINLHPSLLPKYRGAAPIHWALINGDSQTAVTTISLSKYIDSGAILLQETVDIKYEDNYGTLANRLSKIGADLVVKTLDGIEVDYLKGMPQDESKVTLAPKIKSNDYKIDWTKTAKQIHDLIRAFSPSPGAFTTFNGKRLKIFYSVISNVSSNNKKCGEIVICSKNQLIIQTGNGLLEIREVQLEGKKRINVEEYLRGTKLQSKMLFGD